MIPTILLFFALGFIFEYIDSSLGGGYGTCLTPIFLLMGYSPLQIVPMILLSETITGFWGGFNHYRYKNVDGKVVLVVSVLAILGSLVGASVVVSVTGKAIKTYIGVLVIFMGFLTVLKKLINFHGLSLKRVACVGLICGFNKLLTGGGFGPVSTAGLHFSGVNIKKSVGSTTLAEGVMSFSGIILYAALFNHINWVLAVPLFIGAFLACVPSAYTTHKLPEKVVPYIIGAFMVILGVLTLSKTYVF